MYIMNMDFDTEKFIVEVQNRPAIWCSNHQEQDRVQRYLAWEELAGEYGGNFMSDHEKKRLLENLQKKWRNIRDCFVKAHKSKTTNTKKKFSYGFYDNLLFLLDPSAAAVNSTSESNEIDIEIKVEPTEYDPLSLSLKPKKRRKLDVPVAAVPSTFINETPKNLSEEETDDEDRMFFLSLVKEFNKIPEHQRIQTKIDLLKVIKDAQFSG